MKSNFDVLESDLIVWEIDNTLIKGVIDEYLNIELNSKAIELINKVKKHNIQQVICSTNKYLTYKDPYFIRLTLFKLGIPINMFDDVYIDSNIDLNTIINIVKQRLGCNSDKVILVKDERLFT